MALSVQRNFSNTFWPLGLVTVVTPGTPVPLMSVADPNNLFNPKTQTPGTSGASEYAQARAQQVKFIAVKSVAPQVDNVGAVYILIAPAAGGTGNRTDSGSIVAIIQSGTIEFLGSAALNRNVFSLYSMWVDADNAGDGVLPVLLSQ